MCPPNINLIALSNLLPVDANPLELKRAYRALLITGAGTLRSTAVLTVHLPSPESGTDSSNLSNVGLSRRTFAVRSSNQLLMTLPRRHNPATSPTSIP